MDVGANQVFEEVVAVEPAAALRLRCQIKDDDDPFVQRIKVILAGGLTARTTGLEGLGRTHRSASLYDWRTQSRR